MIVSMLKEKPCVFAVGNTYHIIVLVESESVMWVRVGDRNYYDDSNGILRSGKNVHKMIVPMDVLDKEKKYVICEREVIERKPYKPDVKDVQEFEFDFRPVTNDSPKAYHVADAHNFEKEPIKAAKNFGDIDFLILNGDIPNHSGEIENFRSIYKIAGDITNGNLPVVFSRGNHDMRGKYAENLEEYTPTDNGKSYYTFRLGNVWGIILDCGEDKIDEWEDYNGTICCRDFKFRQTEFIKDVIENAKTEYEAEGIKTKLVISHVPFSVKQRYPFDIDYDIYGQWVEMMNNVIKPDLAIAGHMHGLYVCRKGDEHDNLGMDCPVVVGSDVTYEREYHAGAGFVFNGGENIEAFFVDSDGKCEKAI